MNPMLVGDPNIQPRYVGDPNIQPRYVGAPLQKVDVNGNPIQFSEQEFLAGNVTWFGLGATVVPAGSLGTVVDIKPQRPITPQSFRIPSTTQGMLVNQVSIAGTNIFAGQAGTPQEFFSEVSTAPQLEFPTIDTSTGVQITMSNPTGADIRFTGGFYGTALRR